jgi:exopolyphosphatase/guanosine-5'-triphosphate,3'-diphosphate pyrophosphatase
MLSLIQKSHSEQVVLLSEKIFNCLRNIHRLKNNELSWLKNAALLHDIGWVNGRAKHHKRSRDMIIKCPYLPFTNKQRLIIALISRYHRGSLPKDTHKYFKDLSPASKNKICWLAGILKLADGFDRTHLAAINNIKCKVSKRKITLSLIPKQISPQDKVSGLKKRDILEKISGRKIDILS